LQPSKLKLSYSRFSPPNWVKLSRNFASNVPDDDRLNYQPQSAKWDASLSLPFTYGTATAQNPCPGRDNLWPFSLTFAMFYFRSTLQKAAG
jgi:hypothetical protein